MDHKIIITGVPAVEAPDPNESKKPWVLDAQSRPVPVSLVGDRRVVMSSTYAFHVALALAQMKDAFVGNAGR